MIRRIDDIIEMKRLTGKEKLRRKYRRRLDREIKRIAELQAIVTALDEDVLNGKRIDDRLLMLLARME